MGDFIRRGRVWVALLFAVGTIVSGAHSSAQFGFTASGSGIIPAGEFARTEVSRRPPKSGAEAGHAVGAGIAWEARVPGGLGLGVITLSLVETQFGNDVPVSVYFDELRGGEVQFVTPESGIRARGWQVGLRIIPWSERRVTPIFGGGYERLKLKVDSRAFFGPGPQPGPMTEEASPIHIINESGAISGVFLQGGLQTRSDRSLAVFGEVVYHMLFSDGVSATTTHESAEETSTERGTIKSDFQWWEIRGGLVFLLGG